ncbi:alpha/beta hydrolase [Paenibacillus mesophilus]|uniref:alpha/beta hydrolase n=1 Tax=Paenibacillus mesophilus TaxID=2582849 RepID=UPI00110E047E|nr:alpha/beta hydrolase [Paenibacillus mesophilus]TMV45565.1 alpha/beta hydrolase [Paenibacillus mesophilus]
MQQIASKLPPSEGEVVLPGTEQRYMRSSVGGREYRISVAMPAESPPPAGFPVIYLLDANSVFGTMVEAIRVQGGRPEKTGVAPAVIVGIGYRTDAPFAPSRYYDFTLPAADSELPVRPDGRPWPEHGGADSFLTFLENDLMPTIESEYPIDRSRRTLFGHSLGGLFVLHTLFTKPSAFRTYVAGSPSIHWNKAQLRREEEQFLACPEREPFDAALLIAAGELENTHKSGMNRNAKELAERLSVLADRGLRVEYKEFEGEGHISVLPVLVNRAIRFAQRSGSF